MKLHQTLFFILLFFIYGCDGESIENNSNIEQSVDTVDIESHDVQKKALTNDVVLINVGATTDSSAELKISKHVLLNKNPDCVINDIDGLNMSISSNGIGECRYEYTVTPKNESLYDGESKSIVRVSISETAQENTLTAINKETNLDTDVVIDIEAELSSELSDSDYQVVDDVTVVGSGFAHVDTIENTITYTPETIGVSEIMYSITDGVNTLLGSIYVSVSDTENTPPVANNYVKDGVILKGTMIEVDLSDVISDEEDEVLLDTVNAYNANVSITSSTDHTFTFESDVPGGHEMTYTISDGRGGYAVAQVYIEVEADFSLIQDWEDITIHDSTIAAELVFTAPVGKLLAEYTNTDYTSYQIQDGETGPKYAEVATMNLDQAQNYCASRNGRLPITREWELLLDSYGNLFHSQNWPAGMDYWSADMLSANTGRSFNATTGFISELDKESQLAFVTCVLLNSENINDFSTELTINSIIDANSDVEGKVVDPDGEIASYQDIKLSSEHQYGVFSNGASEIELIANNAGMVKDTYVDNFLRNEVISAYTSSNSVDSVVYKSNGIGSIYIADKIALESETKIPGHIVELNVVSVNLQGEESLVNNDFVEYSSSDISIAKIVQNTVHILADGEVTITASYKGLKDSYVQTSLIPLIEISGGWIMQVGEQQDIEVIYSIDNGYSWVIMGDGFTLSTSNSSVISIGYQGEQAIATGLKVGTSILSAEYDLNGFLYLSSVEGRVIEDNWCYKTAISDVSNDTVCIGYVEDVVEGSIGELVITYGHLSGNPYTNESNASLFCHAFGTEIDTSVSEDLYRISGTFGNIENVTAWATSSGLYDSTMYNIFLTLRANTSTTSSMGVPICILSDVD